MKFWFWMSIILLAVGLAACAPEIAPTPQQTAETDLAEPVPVTVERVEPTHTATLIPINTPIPTATPIPILPTVTLTKGTSPIVEAATPLPELVWTAASEIMSRIDGNSLVWSPVRNEFIFNTCPDDRFPQTPNYLFFSAAPGFLPIDISSPEVTCRFSASFMWRPDGQQLVFEGLPAPEDDLLESEIWMMNRNGQNLQRLGRGGRLIDFGGWMDNNIFVYRDHWGMWNKLVHVLEINKNLEIASAYTHAAEIDAITSDFIVTNDGVQREGPYSAAFISPQVINTDDESHINFLSIEDQFTYLFNSSVVDTALNHNLVLVRTWDASEYLTDTLHTHVDLQLWDLLTNELTMLVPGSYTGQITPDGQYLAALIPKSEYSQLQLSNQFTDEVIFVRPAYAGGLGRSSLSFSPNGRYFTFFTPETDLVVYDIQTGEMLPHITAVPAEPLWSPDSTRFVYADPAQGLSIYDTRDRTTYPLAESGGERLSNPQWSYDGAYLSVAYKTEDHEWQTAVLSLP